MKKAQIIITSCSRRTIELERVKNFLIGNGYSIVEGSRVSKEADLVLYSTCAFTLANEDLSVQTINEIKRDKNPSAELVVCGCLPGINPDRLKQVFDGETFGPRSYERLNEILKPERKLEEFPHANTLQITRSHEVLPMLARAKALIGSQHSLQDLKNMPEKVRRFRYWEKLNRITGYGEHEQFYIQIMEGCPLNCSFCAIPIAIGRKIKSKPVDDVINEFQAGLAQGYQTFRLMGDSVSTYGIDIGTNFETLLDRVIQLEGDFSLDLNEVHAFALAKLYPQIKTLCDMNRIPTLWLCIQSANPRILRLMRRSCDVDDVRDKMLEVKRGGKVRLGNSVIVGFPSETREELNDTIEFCRQVGFDFVVCHGFSARPETDAAKLPNPIPPEEIMARSNLVKSELQSRTCNVFQQ